MIRVRGAIGVVFCAISLTACSGVTSGAPVPASVAVTTTAPLATVTTVSTANFDRKVCAGEDWLAQRGQGFYPTYRQLMQSGGQGMSISPVELAAQLAGLTTVAAEGDGIDGSAIVDQAGSDIRLPVSTMIRDADRLAQHYADVAKGGLSANSDMTPIITSFTNALVACTKAGYQPTWFKPEELVRK